MMSALGHSRHCRDGQKSAFVRFTPLATVLSVGPIGRDVPIAAETGTSRGTVAICQKSGLLQQNPDGLGQFDDRL
jgi:hypothetical protein